MSHIAWSFADCAEWLRVRSDAVRRSGASVVLDVQESSSGFARLRIERGLRIGELTVWGDGRAHVVILDLRVGDFVFERDGVSLVGPSPEPSLDEFFALLDTPAA
jgi:hypothetical protein